MTKKICFCLFLTCSWGIAQTLPQFFSDNMVLQQNDSIPIWGEDLPGQRISISSSWGASGSSTANAKGEWKLYLPTPAAGGPYELYIKGSELDTLQNVLIGEVWLAAGQSNMNIPLKGYRNTPIDGGLEAIVNAGNPDLRFFRIHRNPTLIPDKDVTGSWKVSNSENAPDFSAVAYFFAKELQTKLNVPVGIITTSWGGSKVQAWLGKESIGKFDNLDIPEKLGSSSKDKRTTPTSLYNGMLYPLKDYPIKGILWYQGESDRETENYEQLFKELITSWRAQWHDEDLPFYFVQIAPFSYEKLNPVPGGDAARVRDAQLQTYLSLKNVGMVVTTDLGDCHDVHPSDKRPVGERLAYWALGDAYKFPIPYKTPVFQEAYYEEDTGEVRVTFRDAPMGFIHRKSLAGFYLSSDGSNFYSAQAKINDDGTVSVWKEGLSNPISIRYGYGDCISSNLTNTYGFPVSPFQALINSK